VREVHLPAAFVHITAGERKHTTTVPDTLLPLTRVLRAIAKLQLATIHHTQRGSQSSREEEEEGGREFKRVQESSRVQEFKRDEYTNPRRRTEEGHRKET
jgi:hypothetical protein